MRLATRVTIQSWKLKSIHGRALVELDTNKTTYFKNVWSGKVYSLKIRRELKESAGFHYIRNGSSGAWTMIRAQKIRTAWENTQLLMDAYRKNVTIELNNDFCMSVLIYLLLFNNKDSFNSKSFWKTTTSRPLWTEENRHSSSHFECFFSSFDVCIFIHIYCFMNKYSLIFVCKRHKPFQEPFFRLIFSCFICWFEWCKNDDFIAATIAPFLLHLMSVDSSLPIALCKKKMFACSFVVSFFVEFLMRWICTLHTKEWKTIA